MASKDLVESHEDRLQTLQEDVSCVKSDVARVEERVEHLGAQLKQEGVRLSKEIGDGFRVVHQILDPLKLKLETHDKSLADLAAKQLVRNTEERKKTAKWKKVSGVLIAIFIAAAGAFAKVGVEQIMKGTP